MSSESETIRGGGSFSTTCWTRVMSAKGDSTESREALSDLCEDYYEPVIAYLRRAGYREEGAARDVAHEFFAELLGGGKLQGLERERGKFRSYLLGALKHHLSHQWGKRRAAKRGGGAVSESLNETGAAPVEDVAALPPDAWFDQQWAIALLARALKRVELECAADGKTKEFEALSPWLTGESEYGDQAALAESLNVPANTLKSLIHRLRKRFRAAVKDEVARTLDGAGEVDAEMGALFAALGGE